MTWIDRELVADMITDLEADNARLNGEIDRLTTALKYIRDVATEAALGKRPDIDHFWYAEEVTRTIGGAA